MSNSSNPKWATFRKTEDGRTIRTDETVLDESTAKSKAEEMNRQRSGSKNESSGGGKEGPFEARQLLNG